MVPAENLIDEDNHGWTYTKQLLGTGPWLKTFTTFDGRSGGELNLAGTPATLLAGPGPALPAIRKALGAMQCALELTCDYVRTRKQYGQPLSDFQALRHRQADMAIDTEQARSIVQRGLLALIEGPDAERSAMAAAVKARTAQAAMFVCRLRHPTARRQRHDR